ncbi:hypothetical protein P4829_07225 [Bacillus atrophaeus]|uniref:hypothetical protein n=2 Tax=Bacillus atrophaeus TaxID=1452 RepID=UPI00032D7EC8|nr:hypothetical protein [Bacillus atrophaeus]AKL84045.1 hypothetical protein D068_cds13310 [Bacillus atrophaeus UCMB-5137]WFE15462.1 hypothetical protein P4829_07225 [Bacillus atrophaeus]
MMKKFVTSALLLSSLAIGASTANAKEVQNQTFYANNTPSNISSKAITGSVTTHVKNGVTNQYLASRTASASQRTATVISNFTPNNAIKLSIKGWQASVSGTDTKVKYTLYNTNGRAVTSTTITGDIKKYDTANLYYKVLSGWNPGVQYYIEAENLGPVGVNLGLDAYWDVPNN